jgi:hypothetical protein
MTRRACPAGLLVVLALTLATSGCSSGKRYKVTGKVLVNGQPAAGAIVVLTPTGNPGTMDRKPSAVAGADGTFALNTLAADDGVAPGDYLVTVTWPGKPVSGGRPKGLGGDDERATTPDQLRGKYSDPQQSGLKVTVEPRDYELAPIDLSN